MQLSPDAPIRCLLVYPEFPENNFWNYRKACEAIGAKTPNIPLGLITVAAILPQFWQFKLVDLNVRPIAEDEWDWADIVAGSAMLPQQQNLLNLLAECNRRGKFIVVGGPDVTNQSHIYAEADARVLGEAEVTVPLWLDSWRNGAAKGTFASKDQADMTKSPVPRYDLVNFLNYAQPAIQISRGCPFNCEFCDIIVLFGRKSRNKSPQQVIIELETIYKLGYRGHVDVVDDNFIGNKRFVKRQLLPDLSRWNRRRLRPFYFTTEASMNLGDDVELMRAMVYAGFRTVFLGIETPDPKLLLQTQKSQNTMQPMQERIRKILGSGLFVTGGFIIGFDNEADGMDEALIKCIEESPVAIPMVGLLVALPETQLYKRLEKEGRLLGFDGKLSIPGEQHATDSRTSVFEIADQTSGGLNFVPTRDRYQILKEYVNVIDRVYDPAAYLDRLRRQVRLMYAIPKRMPRIFEFKRELPALFGLFRHFLAKKETRWPFLRFVATAMLSGVNNFDMGIRFAGLYLHFEGQRQHVKEKVGRLMDMEFEGDAKQRPHATASEQTSSPSAR